MSNTGESSDAPLKPSLTPPQRLAAYLKEDT